MATVIRFSRHGTKKRPYFRMVVQNKTAARDGRFIEHIGAFDPVKGDSSLVVKRDRLDYWLSTGAIMSDTVAQRVKVLRTLPAGSKTEEAPKQRVKKAEAEKGA